MRTNTKFKIAIHGISDEKVANEPTFKQLAPEIAELIHNCDLAGYNSNKFDIPLLVEEFLRVEVDFHMSSRKAVDVQNIFHKMEQRTLVAAYKFYCDKDLTNAHSIILSLSISEIEKIAENSFVHFIAPIDPPSYPENKTGRTLHRSNVINAEYTSGRHYNGEGINIMMQDDGEIGPHIDYQGRINQSAVSSSSGSHGDHVAGTIMGAGNLDPYGKGMADGAFLYDL